MTLLIRLQLLFVCLLIIAGGCGGAKQPAARQGQPVMISFWNGFTGPDGTTMEQMVRRFNQENPDIQVRMQIIAWATYYDKLTLGLAYGGAPDVFILHTNRFPEFAHHASLESLDEMLLTGEIDKDDFVERVWDTAVWEEVLYGIPLDCHPLGLYYNTELFEQAGIVDASGRARPPATLDEFLDAAGKLTKDLNGNGLPDQWGFAFTWLRSNSYTFLNQFNTAILDRQMKRSDLTSQQAINALSLMKDITYRHRVSPPPEGLDSWMGFQTGRVAMALEGIYMLSSLEQQQNLKFAAAPCPQFGPKMAVWGGSHLLCMPQGISEEHKKAAWKFITYLSDNSLDWSKGGQVPVRKSILSSDEFRKMEVQYQFSRSLPYVQFEPPSISFNQVAPFADAAVEAVMGNIKPPAEALEEADRRINTVLERQ